jgi:AraC-like DNA-binding protein
MRVSDVFSPPPPQASRFRSDHLDEIHAFIAAYDGNHRRAVLGHGPLGHSVRAARCGQVDLGWTVTRTRQQVGGVPQAAILHVPLGRRHVYAVGGRTLEARPDTAILLAPGQEFTLYFEPDDGMVAMRLPSASLGAELIAREPAAARTMLDTREIPLAGARFGALAALHRALVDATTPTSAGASAPSTAQLEARLCTWIADQILGTRASSPTPALAIQRVRRVEAWIDAHLTDPITLGRLCAVAGVGDRYLESAFRAHRGQTPMQFVAARRLAWVRRSLLESRPGDSVTQFAHDAGFIHLGRFAARYRSAYRESPSATLRRSLQRS